MKVLDLFCGAGGCSVGYHRAWPDAGEFDVRCAAMGIDWMTNAELTQAIPPAYCQWIGEQLVVERAS